MRAQNASATALSYGSPTFSPIVNSLAVTCADYVRGNYSTGAIALWDITDPAHPTNPANLTDPTGWIFSAAYRPDGALLATGNGVNVIPTTETAAAASPARLAMEPRRPLTRSQPAQIPGIKQAMSWLVR
jgi:hypothetical protein